MDMDDMMMMDDADDGDATNPFCVGPDSAMTMFMTGFTSSLRHRWWRFSPATARRHTAPPCLNLFFTAWTLDTEGKFLWACFDVFLLAWLVEGVGFIRRARSAAHGPGVLSTLALVEAGSMYATQLTLGYFLMLAVMTYSSEIFASAVVGIAFANLAFRALERARSRKKDGSKTPTPRVSPSCAVPGSCCVSSLAGDELYRPLHDGEDDPETATPAPECSPTGGFVGLAVPGMTCEACVQTVTDALLSVAGVTAVQTSLRNGRVFVYGTGEYPLAKLADALKDVGYAINLGGDLPLGSTATSSPSGDSLRGTVGLPPA